VAWEISIRLLRKAWRADLSHCALYRCERPRKEGYAECAYHVARHLIASRKYHAREGPYLRDQRVECEDSTEYLIWDLLREQDEDEELWRDTFRQQREPTGVPRPKS
jgi:hypothetical protein